MVPDNSRVTAARLAIAAMHTVKSTMLAFSSSTSAVLLTSQALEWITSHNVKARYSHTALFQPSRNLVVTVAAGAKMPTASPTRVAAVKRGWVRARCDINYPCY